MQRIESRNMRLFGQKGFTLLELTVVVGIVVVLTVVGLSALTDVMSRSRLTTATRNLKGDFDNIRMYARANQQSDVIAVVATDGYKACVDTNKNLSCDAGEVMITNKSGTGYGITYSVTSTGAGATAPYTLIRYDQTGRLIDANRLIKVSMPSAYAMQYRVTIYQTGLTEVSKSGDGTTWIPGL